MFFDDQAPTALAVLKHHLKSVESAIADIHYNRGRLKDQDDGEAVRLVRSEARRASLIDAIKKLEQ